MPSTVAQGFDELLGRIPATDAVTDKLKRHRESIRACLASNFNMTNFVPAGSFGHGTNIPRYSDVDYFMVQDVDDWPNNSATALRNVKNALANRFAFTDVRVSSPVVLVPFGQTSTERFEITPAFLDDEQDEHEIFWIPDRQTGWMPSAPREHNAYVTGVNQDRSGRAKPLIRLVKLWNGLCSVGLRSIYLELRIARRLEDVDGVTYSVEVAKTLAALHATGLRAMRDPIRVTGLIEPCSEARKAQALIRVESALIRAKKALAAEESGNARLAFSWWNKVFNGKFPAYR
jgi:hypothetical protein